jgi:hypothetical protein
LQVFGCPAAAELPEPVIFGLSSFSEHSPAELLFPASVLPVP